jgi:hypothetical protein
VLRTNQAPRMTAEQHARAAAPTPLRLMRTLPEWRQTQSVGRPPKTLPISAPISTTPCKYPDCSTDTSRVRCRKVGNQLTKNMYPATRQIC